MGDEVSRRYYDAKDFSGFRQKLDEETERLRQTFIRNGFSRHGQMAGFELEAWLVDAAGDPLAENERFLERLAHPLVVAELAMFNVEVNGTPTALTGPALSRLHDELADTWSACLETARGLGARLATIGILPTVGEGQLNSRFMSRRDRYRTLNDRIMALRDGRPVNIAIEGDVALMSSHYDVMLEAAATSFQIHLQCQQRDAVRDFNASIVASAPMVAASANSPFLFGHDLWDETRVPLFEQAVDVGGRYPPRVSFGSGYLQHSLLEIFEENQREHPILIPAELHDPPARFAHVRFHNGTLWRWNRPLIGFDDDGTPHLRIEHRVVPAGPTLKDCIANAAFYYGLVRGFGLEDEPIHDRLAFAQARDNFYNTARYGLNARVCWPTAGGERECSIRTLIQEELLPLATRGLEALDLAPADIGEYLGVVAARVESSQNGAAWQRRWVARHGPDLHALLRAYLEHQDRGDPVHTWGL
jgi:gamma-glutamyl:cysteine ligase YbdK (ATP-grasp superfamily)